MITEVPTLPSLASSKTSWFRQQLAPENRRPSALETYKKGRFRPSAERQCIRNDDNKTTLETYGNTSILIVQLQKVTKMRDFYY
jgi:hypothetical protein